MSASHKPPHEQQPPDKQSQPTAGWAGIIGLALAALCCGLPLLLIALTASGTLSAVGAVLNSPLFLTAGGLVLVAAIAIAFTRHRHRR